MSIFLVVFIFWNYNVRKEPSEKTYNGTTNNDVRDERKYLIVRMGHRSLLLEPPILIVQPNLNGSVVDDLICTNMAEN